ncbi:hypothetical protein [Actinocorallia populi]|nr:hypothetical protein [Actinocorallia populi]
MAFSARGGRPFTETPDTSELMTVLSTEPGHAHMRRLVGAAMAKDPAIRPTTGQILDGPAALTGEDHDHLPHDPPF